jgi:hypothetical protein
MYSIFHLSLIMFISSTNKWLFEHLYVQGIILITYKHIISFNCYKIPLAKVL